VPYQPQDDSLQSQRDVS